MKTVYPYAEAREQGFAIFRSSKSPKSIYAALHAHGKKHGEKWKATKVGVDDFSEMESTPVYRLEKVAS